MTANPSKRPIYAGDWRRSAGRPYRPSNGTEGEIFQDMWCRRCTRDAFEYVEASDTFEGESCPILCLTMTLSADQADYPPEWRHDGDGVPECTAFEPREGEGDDGTGDLFQ